MDSRKVTSSVVLSLIAAIMIGSLASSCSNDDFEGQSLTLASRRKCNTERNTTPGPGLFQCTNACEDGPYTFQCTGKQGYAKCTIRVNWKSERVSPNDKTNLNYPFVWYVALMEDSLDWDVVKIKGDIGRPTWSGYNPGAKVVTLSLPCNVIVRLQHQKTHECLYDTILPNAGYLSHDVPACISYEPIP